MEPKNWVSTKEAAEFLGVTKPQVLRLINENKLVAKLITESPVPYYLIEKESLSIYKRTPKNKGGRPPKKG